MFILQSFKFISPQIEWLLHDLESIKTFLEAAGSSLSIPTIIKSIKHAGAFFPLQVLIVFFFFFSLTGTENIPSVIVTQLKIS